MNNFNINFVFFGNKNAPNGAAVFFDSLYRNRKKFLTESVSKIDFYFEKREKDPLTVKSLNISKIQKLRKLLQKIAHKNLIGCLVVFYIFALRHAIKVVNSIESSKFKSNNDKWLFNDIFSAYFFCKKTNSKHIGLILHNDGDPSKMIFNQFSKLKKPFFRKIIEKQILFTLQKCSTIVLLSESANVVFKKKYRELSQSDINLEVIPNGVYFPKISNNLKNKVNPDKPNILGVSVGSISYRKGHDLLAEALTQLNTSKNNLTIKCIGNVQDIEILNMYNGELIEYLGPIKRDEIQSILAIADFFILCSRDEGMPISIIEAMQMKLPIFSTNVGSIPEMIDDGKSGVLMNPEVKVIKNCINDIINGKYDLKEMGNNSYNKYEEVYTFKKMIISYNRIIQKL